MKHYPQKISLRDAIEIRESVLDISKISDPFSYPFVMLQKIMAFDSKCRIEFSMQSEIFEPHESESESEDDSGDLDPHCGSAQCYRVNPTSGDDSSTDSDSENAQCFSVHPMDGLLALIHCSDNFLRQDIFSRLATCQIAVPLLLPDPCKGEPTLQLWALRSIVKDFKLSEGKGDSDRIITYPTPFVSFLRLGSHAVSKSEVLNGIMSKADSEQRNLTFFNYNSPGNTKNKCLVNGLVEISWYVPGNDWLYQQPIAFTNLRGDANNPNLDKQVDFLCNISTVHVILLSNDVLQDDVRESTTKRLKILSRAPGGVIVLKTKKGLLDLEKPLLEKLTVIKCHKKSATELHEHLRRILVCKLKDTHAPMSLSTTAKKLNICVDEDDKDCIKGKELMEKSYAVVDEYKKCNSERSPRDLLPLQSKRAFV